MRAKRAENQAAYKSSGAAELYRQAEALEEQANEIFNRICETKPVTLAGAIAMLKLEQVDTEDLLDTVIEGLRDFCANEGGASRPTPAAASGDDRKILSLFCEWRDAVRVANNLPGGDEHAQFQVACDHCNDLERAIIDMPSAGQTGLAVKAYLRHCHDYGSDDQAVLRPFPEYLEGYLTTDLERSIIKDVVRFVPELAPLAAAVIEGDDLPGAEEVPTTERPRLSAARCSGAGRARTAPRVEDRGI